MIVPARNEEDCIADCLRSLTAQSENGFRLGRDWELILADDGSTDKTRSIARRLSWHYDHRSRTSAQGLDRQGERTVEGLKDGTGHVAAFYRCRHNSRAGRPAACHSRSGEGGRGDAFLFASPDTEGLLAACADAAGFLRTCAGIFAAEGLRSELTAGCGQRTVSAHPPRWLHTNRWPRGRRGQGS